MHVAYKRNLGNTFPCFCMHDYGPSPHHANYPWHLLDFRGFVIFWHPFTIVWVIFDGLELVRLVP